MFKIVARRVEVRKGKGLRGNILSLIRSYQKSHLKLPLFHSIEFHQGDIAYTFFAIFFNMLYR